MRAWLLLVALAACYSPAPETACTVRCTADHACPGNLTCVGGWCQGGSACVLDARPFADGPPADSVDAPSCTVSVANAVLVADAYLDSNSPDAMHGNDSLVRVDSQRSGVWRFVLPVMPAQVLRLDLITHYAIGGDPVCQNGCIMNGCIGNERTGLVALWPMRSDWVETEVDYARRANNASWASSGASSQGNPGSADRGTTSTQVQHTAGIDDVTFTMAGTFLTDVLAWTTGSNELSFIAEPPSGQSTQYLAASSTYGCFNNLDAQLVVTSCQ